MDRIARAARRLGLPGLGPQRLPQQRHRRQRLGEALKRIHAATNLPEAQLLVDLLAHRGVRARIFNANAASIAGELPIDATLPQIWVEHPRDAERAREIIETFLRARTTGPAIKCPHCGEENPPSFDLCWNCGKDLGN